MLRQAKHRAKFYRYFADVVGLLIVREILKFSDSTIRSQHPFSKIMRQRKKQNKRHSNQFVQCFAKKFFGNLVLRSIKQCDQRRLKKKDPETGFSLEKEIKLQKVRQNHILIVVLFDWKKVELVKNLKIFLPSGKVPSDHIKSKNAETKKEKKNYF